MKHHYPWIITIQFSKIHLNAVYDLNLQLPGFGDSFGLWRWLGVHPRNAPGWRMGGAFVQKTDRGKGPVLHCL